MTMTEPGNVVVQQLRAELGLSQKAFAVAVGLTTPFISHLETGKYHCGRDAALKIWDTHKPEISQLGFSFEDLVRG